LRPTSSNPTSTTAPSARIKNTTANHAALGA
jgi:hypothetical protein